MNNIDKFKAYGIDLKKDIRFYYRKMGEDPDTGAARGVIVTACVVRLHSMPKQFFVRGLAIRNPSDQFNKKLGRNIALGRAMAALEREMTFGLVEDLDLSSPVPLEFAHSFTSLYCTADYLTEFERSLFKEGGSAPAVV